MNLGTNHLVVCVHGTKVLVLGWNLSCPSHVWIAPVLQRGTHRKSECIEDYGAGYMPPLFLLTARKKKIKHK